MHPATCLYVMYIYQGTPNLYCLTVLMQMLSCGSLYIQVGVYLTRFLEKIARSVRSNTNINATAIVNET